MKLQLYYTLIIMILDSTIALEVVELMKSTSIIQYENAQNAKLNRNCYNQLQEIVNNSRFHDVLIKMMDATSKLPSGLLEGNVVDFGNYDECVKINEIVNGYRILGKYCFAGIAMHFETPLLLSVCIPNECNPTDVISNTALIAPNNNICSTRKSKYFDFWDFFTLSIISIILVLIIISTTYDIYQHVFRKKCMFKALLPFSLYSNGKRLFTRGNQSNHLCCLNGMKFLSIIWIVLGHRFAMSQILPFINFIDTIHYKEKLYTEYIQGAFFAVDTLFFITGLLIMYNIYHSFVGIRNNMGIWSNTSNWRENSSLKFKVTLQLYFQRYLRLTPPVAMVYLFHISLLKHMGSGPLYDWILGTNGYMTVTCKKYWWSVLFHVQNYANLKEMCLLHYWYLSVDMQVFLLLPLVLWPMVYYPKQMLRYAIPFIMIGYFVGIFTLAYLYELQMFSDDYNYYFLYLTHTRFMPYIIGMVIGYYILQYKDKTWKVNPILNVIVWIITLCTMLSLIVGQHYVAYEFSPGISSAIFIAFHKPLWAIACAWIVWSCVNGYGGPINWILTRPIFQILGKLTYSIYLVHGSVIIYLLATVRTQSYFDNISTLHLYGGDLLFTFVVATIWCLLFESPVYALDKLIFGKRNN